MEFRPAIRLRGALATAVAAAALVAGSASPASAFVSVDIARYQAATPKCDANPSFGWVGRVSGEVDNNFDTGQYAVSFVGCFPTREACDTWRERALGLITQVIVQNSCAPRTPKD